MGLRIGISRRCLYVRQIGALTRVWIAPHQVKRVGGDAIRVVQKEVPVRIVEMMMGDVLRADDLIGMIQAQDVPEFMSHSQSWIRGIVADENGASARARVFLERPSPGYDSCSDIHVRNKIYIDT